MIGLLHEFSDLKIWKDIDLKVAKFGSTVSGFASRKTDCDLTIITNCYISEKKLLEYLNEFLSA